MEKEVMEFGLHSSGERRQLACGVRQLAERDLVGKLPTSAGWQPALPRVYARKLRLKTVSSKLIDSNRQSGSDREV